MDQSELHATAQVDQHQGSIIHENEDEVQSQSDELDGSDWSAAQSEERSGDDVASISSNKSVEQNISQNLTQNDSSELQDHQASKLISVQEIHVELIKKNGGNIGEDAVGQQQAENVPLQELGDRIRKLELENEELKSQIRTSKSSTEKETTLEPNLVRFLENHRNDITLDLLKWVHEILTEIRSSIPTKNFREYVEELIRRKKDYENELAEVRARKNEVEIKLNLMKRRYEDELSSCSEARVEHIFKNSGAKEYFDKVKEVDRVKNDTIHTLKTDIATKKKELAALRSKYHEIEDKCQTYWQSWKDAQLKKEQLEAERKAQQEQDLRLRSQPLNMSSASSYIDNQVPPPPPIDVPTVEEILRMSSNQYMGDQNYAPMGSLNHSIPPPPPVDVPYDEIMGHVRSNSSSYSSQQQHQLIRQSQQPTTKAKVGGRYGRVFNS